MFHTAVVPVNRHPVFQLVIIGKRLVVVRVNIAQEIPRRTRPLGHSVGFALCVAAAFRAFAVDEAVDFGKRAFAVGAGIEVFNVRQFQRQFVIRHGDHAAFRAVDNRNRLAPIALAVERPVFHFILHAALADAFFGKVINHAGDRIFFVVKTVQEAGIDHFAVAGVSGFFNVAAADDFDNINPEFLRERIVAVVVRRHRHNRARAVAHHDIVGNINRDFLAVNRVYRGQTVNANAGFVFDQLGALKLGLFRTFRTISVNRVHVADFVGVFVDNRVFGRNNHKGYAEQGVGSCGVNAQRFGNIFEREVHERAAGFTDPVNLLLLDIRQIINLVKPVKQFVGVFGNPQIPNVFRLLNHFAVADVAFAALGIFIGQNDLTRRAVVDERLVTERKPVFKHF